MALLRRWIEAWVVLAALATLPLVIAQERGYADPLVVVGDWAAWLVFVAEYILFLGLARDRRHYVRRNWIGLMVVVVSFPLLPPLLGIVRLLRLARLVFVTWLGVRALGITLGRRGLVHAFLMTGILIFAGSAVFVVMEPETVQSDFSTALWLAIGLATTAGYGELAAMGPWGRVVALLLILTWVGLVATLGAVIAAYFVRQDEGNQIFELRQQLDRIENQLREIAKEH